MAIQGSSVQIQTVVYRIDRASLYRSLDTIANAVRVDRVGARRLAGVKVVHGDASPEPVLSDEEVASIGRRYGEWFDYEYRFFNENTGTARGHNRMFEGCTADYVVIQNPDIQYTPRFFERMIEPFSRTDVRVGLVEARQTPIEHPKEYDLQTMETSWSTTACVMVPSEVMREVGGFDADTFFLYCDDVDFSWRIRLTGRSLVYQPLAAVFHPKYLTSQGHWQGTTAEEYYSALALLLMSYKWSYQQRCDAMLKKFQTCGDEVYGRAAREFVERRESGRLPERLDSEHKVADINNAGYATVRFTV